MSQQLEPGAKHIICRQLNDPADTNTYYVRAYVRKADGDSLLATVNLTDKTEQRFRGEWYVEQYPDPTEITITTKVFTDSGYTTESNLYGQVEQEFLIAQRWSMAFGGGGGVDVSYKKIRQIVKEELLDYPKPDKIDLRPVLSDISMAIKLIKGIKIPEMPKIEFPKQKETDLSPVLSELSNLKETVSALENTDLNPVVSYLHSLESIVKDKKNFDEIREDLKLLRKFIDDFISVDKKQKLRTLKEFISDVGEIGKLEDKPIKKRAKVYL